MKTARFKDVVATAGRPQVHSLWLAPDKDPDLKRAVRDCRVMTLHQALRGTKKDYGTVGLHLEGSTQVLVFPKPLRRFGDRHIVGIDYKLILQTEPKDPVKVKPAAPQPFREDHPPVSPAPKSAPAPKPQNAPAKKERAPKPVKPAAPATRDELVAEVRRALRELKAGKAVAAYERLSALVEK